MPINDKQQAFINEYLINGHNATKAYAKAYPSCKSGHKENASRLLTKDNIKAAIATKLDKTATKMDVSREKQLERLLSAYDMAVAQKNPQAVRSLLAEINVMQGYQRENAPNQEMEQAIKQRQRIQS
jgi:phage terminase small subunit